MEKSHQGIQNSAGNRNYLEDEKRIRNQILLFSNRRVLRFLPGFDKTHIRRTLLSGDDQKGAKQCCRGQQQTEISISGLQLLKLMDSQELEDPFVIIKNVRRRQNGVVVRKISIAFPAPRPFKKKRKFTMDSTKTHVIPEIPEDQLQNSNSHLANQASVNQFLPPPSHEISEKQPELELSPFDFDLYAQDPEWIRCTPLNIEQLFPIASLEDPFSGWKLDQSI